METAISPRYYFDLRKERTAAAKAETSYTAGNFFVCGNWRPALDYVRQMGGWRSGGGTRALVEMRALCGDDAREWSAPWGFSCLLGRLRRRL